jgi:putative membrane protein (TIGR04086 family)
MSAKRKRARRKEVGRLPPFLSASLRALPITLLLGVGLMLLATALLLKSADPNRYHAAVGLALSYLTAMLGGLIATRQAGRRAPLLCGMTEGAALFILFAVASLFLPATLGAEGSAALKLLLRLPLLPAAVLGALLGGREKARRKHRR